MHQYKDLKVWQKAMEICTYVYDLTKKFPPEEKFGLVIQMRKAAVSMPSNIAEGAGKSSLKDFVRFLEISHASSYELDTQGIISKNQEYINSSEFEKLSHNLSEFQKMIYALIKSKSNI
jgi:four helix bundle protein